MAGPITFPDTVFDVSIFNDFPVGIPTAGAQGGRLMSSMPHVDGLAIFAPSRILSFVAGSGTSAYSTTTRNAAGDYYIAAATAANNNIYAVNLSDMMYRSGETYFFAVNEPSAGAKLSPIPPPKGIAITTLLACYNVGTLALTTATLGLYKAVYTNAVARAVSTIVAATGIPTAVSTNNTTLGSVPVTAVPDGAVFLSQGDSSPYNEWWLELNTVQQATSTLNIYWMGVGFNFNWT